MVKRPYWQDWNSSQRGSNNPIQFNVGKCYLQKRQVNSRDFPVKNVYSVVFHSAISRRLNAVWESSISLEYSVDTNGICDISLSFLDRLGSSYCTVVSIN